MQSLSPFAHPAKLLFLRSKAEFFLLAVDANARVRYERILSRKSETDRAALPFIEGTNLHRCTIAPISIERFLADEAREAYSSDPAMQNVKKCVSEADFIIRNDASISQLKEKIDKIVLKLRSFTSF